MIVVGLTGGIATGKTTVLDMFAEEGARVIDFDKLSRSVVEPSKPAWHDIVRTFGDTVLSGDGTLNRGVLGRIVFGDPAKRRELERIVHPRVLSLYEEKLRRIRGRNTHAVVIVDVPLLMEFGMAKEFEKVILAYAPPECQIMRLIERNGLSKQAARNRLKSQMPIEEKMKLADFLIENTGSLENTKRQVKDVYHRLKMLDREKT
jgi:dephospho-CoA kinase